MKKNYFPLMLGLIILLRSSLFAQFATVPVTAVSFPKEALPVSAGKIDFWARLTGFSGAIPVGGVAPHFFQLSWGTTEGDATDHYTYMAGFNSNDGAGNGGLIGRVGHVFLTGTGLFNGWTYENIFGEGKMGDWHHYIFQWNKDGIAGVADGKKKLAIFVDGVLNSDRWSIADLTPGTFPSITSCPTLNLITIQHPADVGGEVAIDEFKIYDGSNNLILYNTLGSASEVEHSVVGLNGSFNGGGNAHFVPGISGNALMATPVYGIGTPACNGTVQLSCPANKVVSTDRGVCSAVVKGIDPVITPVSVGASVSYKLSGATTGNGVGSVSGKTFNKGLTTVVYTLTADGNKTCSFAVSVEDKEAPLVTNVAVTPELLWPPDHKMKEVTVNYTVTDNCGATAVLSVSSNEPQGGIGGNNGAGDWQVIDANKVLLRAERAGKGESRIYTILITATDAAGNQSSKTIAVEVSHDRSGKVRSSKTGVENPFNVRVLPNPSRSSFTVILQSNNDKPFSIRVMNFSGKLVEHRLSVPANSELQLGDSYRAGEYFVEAVQGTKRIVLKLLKE